MATLRIGFGEDDLCGKDEDCDEEAACNEVSMLVDIRRAPAGEKPDRSEAY
jgi:hypothetical protein